MTTNEAQGTVVEHAVPSSAALHDAVAAAICAAKADDRMAAVTVVVDSPLAGTLMRRQLVASGAFGALGTGVAGLRLVTPGQLVDELGSAAGLPAPTQVAPAAREAVVAARLQSHPGPFAASADHPSTVLRLAGALDELRWVDLSTPLPDAGRTTQAVVEFIRGARADLVALTGEAPEADTARAVAAALRDRALPPGAARRIGSVVVAAQRVPAPVRDVLDALASHVPGVTLLRLEPEAPLGHDHLSCPDPSTEAAYAARTVVRLLDTGTRADEIAVLYGSDRPYASLLATELDAAGVGWNGPTATSLGATAFARALDVLLAMAEGHGAATSTGATATGITRPLLLRWFSIGPVPGVEGGTAPTTRWRGLVRDQNLYGDAARWRASLDQLAAAAAELADDAEAGEDEADEVLDRHALRARKQAVEARGLQRFLDTVSTDLAALAGAATWTELATATTAVLDRWVPISGAAAAEATERQARQRVLELLVSELPELDALRSRTPDAPAPSIATLRGLLARDLAARRGRHGDLGVGVHVGPVRGAGTLQFSRIVVVGAAEGALPPLVQEDALLPDSVRTALRRTPDDLRASVESAVEVERDLHALAAGADEVVITWPRAALPGRGAAHPSRFLPVAKPQRSIASRWSSLADEPLPVTAVDLAVRDLLQRDATDVPDELGITVPAARSARASAFDAYHGDLSEIVDELVWDITASPLSASAIEAFLHCPYHFFVQRVLRVSTDTIEDEIDEIAPKDLGTLLHQALEAFVLQADDEGWLPAPGAPWRDDAEEILRDLLDERVRDAEERGLTGWQPAWDARYEVLVSTLGDFLAKDASQVRGAPATAPQHAELRFGGGDGEPEVPFDLLDGRVVRLRGAIDRLDVSADRSAVGVVDYKSGKAASFRTKLGTADGTGREKVQDLVYDAAARALVPEADEVAVRFVFVPDEGSVKVESAAHVADREAMLRDLLVRLADAGSNGRFAPAPGTWRDWCPVCGQMGRRARSVARSVGIDSAETEEVAP